MRLLLDEDCLDPHIAKLLKGHHHEAIPSCGKGGHLSPGAADVEVAALAEKLRAVLVTANHKHFEKLISRAPQHGNHQRFRHAGRISFCCDKPKIVQRLGHALAVIEAEHAIVSAGPDPRLIVEISNVAIRFLR